MSMNKICTSIEQSKELLEIGLDPKTADMCWLSKDNVGIEFFEDPETKDGTLEDSDLPAWSLSALIGVIDSAPELKGFSLFKEDDGWHCNLYGEKEVNQTMGHYKGINGSYFEAVIKAVRLLYLVIRNSKSKN